MRNHLLVRRANLVTLVTFLFCSATILNMDFFSIFGIKCGFGYFMRWLFNPTFAFPLPFSLSPPPGRPRSQVHFSHQAVRPCGRHIQDFIFWIFVMLIKFWIECYKCLKISSPLLQAAAIIKHAIQVDLCHCTHLAHAFS